MLHKFFIEFETLCRGVTFSDAHIKIIFLEGSRGIQEVELVLDTIEDCMEIL